MRTTLYLTPLFGVLLAALPAHAQEPPLELARLGTAVVLDGVLDDAAWQDATSLPLTLYLPVNGGEPRQRTEIRVAYDDEHLYFAGWFYDDDPDAIRINSLYRDRWNGDDAFAIYIDAFNDNRNAKWFGITPAGMRFDVLLSDDGATLNPSWDTFWDARTTVTTEGWFVEVRIPLSSLGFTTDDEDRAVMGLTVTRLVSRTGERVTFPAIDPAFEFRRPSVARDVMMRGVRTRKPLYVTPYALTGVTRTTVPLEPPDFRRDETTAREIGVDVRYPLSSRLTLDVTLNTDFAQVEADEQQVQLDRFPLFFPERRRFFQEGSGIFDLVTGAGSRVFHSRRIGLTADFRPVPVMAGARLVGRVGEWDVGLLDVQTESAYGLPAQNSAVLRGRRRILNPYSTAGFMATSVLSDDQRNAVVAADASLRLIGDDYLTLKGAHSFDSRDAPAADLMDRAHVQVEWDRRTLRGLKYTGTFIRSGSHYRPELGFLPRRNFTAANFLAEYYIFTDSSPRFRRVWPGAIAFSTYSNENGALESGTYAFWLQWETKAGGGGWLEPKWFAENVQQPFTIADRIDIPAGRYRFMDFQVVLQMASGSRLRTSLDGRAGSYFDGRRAQLILTPTWNASPHLELGGEYQITSLRFPARDQEADIHVGRLRVRTALNARASGNAVVQYNSTSGRVDVNVRLRYSFAEGTDLWLVYNEGLDAERSRDASGFRPPLSLSRALLLKYTHTFGL